MAAVAVSRLSLTSACALLAACTGNMSTSAPDAGGRPVEPGSDGAVSVDSAGPDAGPTDAGPACTAEPSSSTLVFDGSDDHVTMGAAPELGLTELTVEAWVRRDGRGRTAGTGVGGVTIVPIAGKGRGERDGSNVDCNYAFGFSGEVLAADFEDMASGANHPVTGVTPIPMGEWHHVAASYDGTTWRLYVDGRLDAERTVNATPRGDSIQHFGIGALFNSTGVAAGALHGAVDELRVWDHARSEAEIAGAMRTTLASGEGLVGRWALDEADGGAPDSLGSNDGTIEGAVFGSPGAALDAGEPPTMTPLSPLDRAELAGPTADLAVELGDPDSDAFAVTFHARELTMEDDFTIVVMPDTQIYTIQGRGLERYFRDQTQWIVDNRDAYDIAAVIHNGDIVQRADRPYEWNVADGAMSTLEPALPLMPDGVPFIVAVGNHDQGPPLGTTDDTANYNRYFGVSRFAGRAYYGGHYGRDNDESFITFNAGGLDFVVVALQFDTTPSAAVLDWARQVFESHPSAFGILDSHYIVNRDGSFGPQGQAIYDALRDVDNLQLMTSGHLTDEAHRTDDHMGNVIHSMLADYQGWTDGGQGYMRIWEFSPANDELTVRTYSPTLDAWETDADSEFTLPVDLSGAGGPFAEVAVLDRATGGASVSIDVEPGRVYEWYAEVTDCAHTVRTPVMRFTTSP